MYFHVLPTIDIRLEGFLAIRAHIWPFVTVRNQMPFHAALGGELCITHRATVRPRIVVCMQVRFEDAVRREPPEKNKQMRILSDVNYVQK